MYELPWDTRPFEGNGPIGFDTETTVVDLKREIPEVVLGTVSDGRRHAVLTPEQLPAFVLAHKDREWVGFHVAFDFHAILSTLRCVLPNDALAAWETMPSLGLFRDVMILDFLLRLRTGEDRGITRPRDLGMVAEDYCGLSVSKNDEHRMRFNEMIGADWSERKWKPWLDYAVADTVATLKAFREIERRLKELPPCKNADPRWGTMTEQIQLRSSLALSDITRRGFKVDRALVSETKERLQGEIKEQVEALQSLAPGLFAAYVCKAKAGELKVNKNTGTPHMIQGVLRDNLVRIAAEEDIPQNKIPKTLKTGQVQCKLDFWKEVGGDHEFVSRWAKLAETGKLLSYLVQLEAEGDNEIHAEYTTMVRTGRTSAKRPNIQQMPREAWFRRMFVARPGYQLVIADYSAIELRTLAAVLLKQFGKSTLYDVLRDGRDPHSYTASLVLGVPYEEVIAGVKHEKTCGHGAGFCPKYGPARQGAKAINFGVPGGLGAVKLAAYARSQYGVQMDQQEAARLRGKLIHEVYPELSNYLAEDTCEVMAANLHCTADDVEEALGLRGRLDKVRAIEWLLYGADEMPAGGPWPSRYREALWDGVRGVNRNPALTRQINSCMGSTGLRDAVYGRLIETLTGRPRAGCRYTESRNTPFQALAADGAKVALWNLYLSGYKTVAFVHDEVVVEVPEDRAERAADDISTILKQSMSAVLYCDLPVEVEWKVSPCWAK